MTEIDLDDAVALHCAAPRTFSIPRREVREALPVGCQVKLLFRLPADAPQGYPGAERMWCVVKGRRAEGYFGELVHQPRYLTSVAAGAEIEFAPRHVAGISYGPSSTRMAPLVGCALEVLRRGAWPFWVGRVAPESRHDSGWRVFAESGDIRVRAVTAPTLLSAWAVLDSVIDGATLGAWRWEADALELVRAEALPPPVAAAAEEGLGRLHRPSPPVEQRAVVSRRALDEAPRCAQRFEPRPDHPDDSGWCIWVGDEPQEVIDDAGHSTLAPLARLLHLYPYLERVLGEPGGRSWEWNDEAGDWLVQE
jgi:hypothetical protein